MTECSIYFNPKCSTCRKTLDLIKGEGEEPKVIEYLKTPPDRKTLKTLLQKLGMKPADLLRKKEPLFKELDLDLSQDEKVLDAMLQHPVLIERPIVVLGDKAVLGRPPENIKLLFT